MSNNTVFNMLHVSFPDGRTAEIALDAALPGEDYATAAAALEEMFPDAEIMIDDNRFYITEEDVEATMYRDEG